MMEQSAAAKPIRCRAAVSKAPGQPLEMEEVEVAPPQEHEVRVKIICTSLCHTDVTFWRMKLVVTKNYSYCIVYADGNIICNRRGKSLHREGGSMLLEQGEEDSVRCRESREQEIRTCQLNLHNAQGLRSNAPCMLTANGGKVW